MKSAFRPLRTGLLITLICCLVAELRVHVASAENPSSAPCALATYHQFDFWIGDWEVFDAGSPNKVAQARIDSILDGCVLHEDYRGLDGHEGQSFTIYDNSRGVWHQTWMTNGGALLQIEGKLEN